MKKLNVEVDAMRSQAANGDGDSNLFCIPVEHLWSKRHYEWTLKDTIVSNIGSSLDAEITTVYFPQWERTGFKELHEKLKTSVRYVASKTVTLGFLIFQHEYNERIKTFTQQNSCLAHSKNAVVRDIAVDYEKDIAEVDKLRKLQIQIDNKIRGGIGENAANLKMSLSGFIRLLVAIGFLADVDQLLHVDQIEHARQMVDKFKVRFDEVSDLFNRLYIGENIPPQEDGRLNTND
jgi:hypothetical protein